jgi:hypothetical protein
MARSRSISRKVRTFVVSGPRRQALVAEAAARMFAARIAILIWPFARISRGFGAFVPPSDPRVGARPPLDPEVARIVREISWAVRRSAPFMPFRSVCLQQAMAAHAMLRRRGIASVMHFGAGRGETKPLDAHAWLDVSGMKVTGYPIAPNLTEIGCFV